MRKLMGLVALAAGGAYLWNSAQSKQRSLRTSTLGKSNKSVSPNPASRKMDEALDDSFPASDPPAWNSSVS